MTKRRASIRGRGAEILLGGPPADESEPGSPAPGREGTESGGESMAHRFPEPAAKPPRAATAEPEPSLDEAELDRLLEEEAQAGEPGPEEEIEPPPVPGAFAVGTQPGLVSESLTEPWDQVEEEVAMYQPPSPEVSDVAGGVLPPKLQPVDIQEPEERIEPIELPDLELTEEEKVQILARLGDERIRALESAIDEAYEAVRQTVGANEGIATDCYNKLLKARDIVVRRDVAKLPQAEYYVKLVQARIKRATDSEAAAQRYQWRILTWGMFWCAIFLSLLILLNESWFRDAIFLGATGGSLVDMDVLLSTMVWGGVGGVVAVLYSLFKHVGQRDFDSHYNLSYVGKPFLGLILGASVYMAFNLLIRALGILPAELQDVGEITAPAVAPGVMYLMAWISGFKENRIFDLMDRAMKGVFSGGDARSAPSTEF